MKSFCFNILHISRLQVSKFYWCRMMFCVAISAFSSLIRLPPYLYFQLLFLYRPFFCYCIALKHPSCCMYIPHSFLKWFFEPISDSLFLFLWFLYCRCHRVFQIIVSSFTVANVFGCHMSEDICTEFPKPFNIQVCRNNF